MSTPFEKRRDALADFPVKMTEFASIFLPTEDASKVTLKSSFIKIEDTSPSTEATITEASTAPALLTAKIRIDRRITTENRNNTKGDVCKSIRGRSTETITWLIINQNLPLPQAILLFKNYSLTNFFFVIFRTQ